MKKLRFQISIRVLLLVLRWHCWFRQKKNKERLIAAAFLLPAMCLLIPTYTFTLTLVQSFLFQAMLLYGILSILWILKYHYRLASINFSIFLLMLVKINQPIDVGYHISQGKEELTVLQFNLLTVNDAHDETILHIKSLNPDLISFQEVSLAWADELENGLSDQYPFYKVVKTYDESQGIAIFSKHPIVEDEILSWYGTINIAGKIQVGTEDINFLALHTRSPTSKFKWQLRNAHINAAEEFVRSKAGEFLVLGDFNTVPWDRKLLRFKSTAELKDSRRKLTPTFPTWNPYLAQIPIDYIFYSKGIQCDSLDAVAITSDHKAIIGKFSL